MNLILFYERVVSMISFLNVIFFFNGVLQSIRVYINCVSNL